VGVVAARQDQFWCAVVSGDYVGRIQLFVQLLGRPEVTNLDDTFLCLEDILRLEVAMGNALLVDVVHALEDLLHVFFNVLDRDSLVVLLVLLDYLLQIFVAVLKHQVLSCLPVLAS